MHWGKKWKQKNIGNSEGYMTFGLECTTILKDRGRIHVGMLILYFVSIGVVRKCHWVVGVRSSSGVWAAGGVA